MLPIVIDALFIYAFLRVRRRVSIPLEDVLTKRHEQIAGVIIEPMVQAVAGIITQPPGYLSHVRALCTKYNVLLIADEVATGFGRTGTMFACDHERVTPEPLVRRQGTDRGIFASRSDPCHGKHV